jgi:DNA primase
LDERACLAAAAELYANRLLSDSAALAYVEGRGIDRATAERHRVGYAGGDELVAYLRWRRLPAQAAIRVGLLGHGGRETMAGRVVVPEIRAGQPIWMVGRRITARGDAPKYLGLPGRKPLLGWESAQGSPTIILVEGPFDWLTLRLWDLPGLALVGTHVRASAIAALARFRRLYVALDNDDAGRVATDALTEALGARAVAVRLGGVKDVADLAPRSDGRTVLEAAVQLAEAGAPPRRRTGSVTARSAENPYGEQ